MKFPKKALLGSALVISLSTSVAEAERRRCDISQGKDVRKSIHECFNPVKYPWKKKEVEVLISDEITSMHPDALLAVRRGFAEWTKTGASLPKVSFRIVPASLLKAKNDGFNTITFGFPEKNLAYTYSDHNGEEMTDVDIVLSRSGIIHQGSAYHIKVFESEEQCRESGNIGYDLQSLITHEAGHFYGMGDQFDGEGIMYGALGLCETDKRTLTSVKERGEIEGLYPSKN